MSIKKFDSQDNSVFKKLEYIHRDILTYTLTYYLTTHLISFYFPPGTIKSRWHSMYILWSIELVADERIMIVTAAVLTE
jgi:hypothetical protein